MKKSFLFLLLFTTSLFYQPKLLSWNIENFGKSKSEAAIIFIANTVKDFDIVALQEARMISNHIPIWLEFSQK
jgi:deoxyribonuclease-1-like protein